MSAVQVDVGAGLTAVEAPEADGDVAFVLAALRQWSEEGWIRRLDSVFGIFMTDLCPVASPTLILSAALLAHMEGRGHTCLQVDDLLVDPDGLLGWTEVASNALRDVMLRLPGSAGAWLDDLVASAVVEAEGCSAGGNEPLVLHGSRLYLRRYRGYERRVATQLLKRGAVHEPVDEAAARRWLDVLFAPLAAKTPSAPQGLLLVDTSASVDWQKVACSVALRGRVSVITGGPGTGKTYCAARLLALLFALDPAPQKLRVTLTAP